MKFTLSWLKEHLETTADLAAIADTLNRIGLEVEEISDKAEELNGFKVVEVRIAVQHPDAERLKVTTVFDGIAEYQVVCGAPNCRAGMKTILAPVGAIMPGNGMVLKQAKMRGQASNGMLCAYGELGITGEDSGIIDLPAATPIGQPAAEALGITDPIIEIGLTPNRGDCAGIRGIARDLAAAGLGSLKPLSMPIITGKFKSPLQIQMEAPDLCPFFAGRYIRGVKNGPSPAWLHQRMEAIGQRSISALVDITNYFTFAHNRPMHVFDADKIHGDAIIVRQAKAGETVTALNNKEYTLDDSMLVLADRDGADAIAGIMGGLRVSSDENTTNMFLEVALWDPINIARTGRALGINSDARYRFERGVDPAFTVPAVELATQMIMEICGGEASELVLAGTEPNVTRSYHLQTNRVETLGGLSLPAERQIKILTALGFAVKAVADDLAVNVPSWRSDIQGEADLVEEILRIHGFDHVPALLPSKAPASLQSLNPVHDFQQSLSAVAISCGYADVVTWSFVPQAQAELFGGGAAPMQLTNPISVEMGTMRPSIIPSLLQAAQRNANMGFTDLALCEIGPIFQSVSPEAQPVCLTMLRAGNTPRHWQQPAKPVDFQIIKADLWAVLSAAGLNPDTLPISRDVPSYYHPGQALALSLGKKVIAYAGVLHPQIKQIFDYPHAVVAAEIFVQNLPLPKNHTVKPAPILSPFQPVQRDLALLVTNDMEAGALRKTLLNAEQKFVTAVDLFDVYAGDKLPAGQKSLAFAITLQPQQQTLTDVEIATIIDKLIAAAAKHGAALRR